MENFIAHVIRMKSRVSLETCNTDGAIPRIFLSTDSLRAMAHGSAVQLHRTVLECTYAMQFINHANSANFNNHRTKTFYLDEIYNKLHFALKYLYTLYLVQFSTKFQKRLKNGTNEGIEIYNQIFQCVKINFTRIIVNFPSTSNRYRFDQINEAEKMAENGSCGTR